MLVHDSSLLTWEPLSQAVRLIPNTVSPASKETSLANGFVHPTQSLLPLLPPLASPQTNTSQAQHLQAASGAGPAPALAENNFSLLLPGSGCPYLQPAPIQFPQHLFLGCSKPFPCCLGISTLSLAHALACNLNVSAQ